MRPVSQRTIVLMTAASALTLAGCTGTAAPRDPASPGLPASPVSSSGSEQLRGHTNPPAPTWDADQPNVPPQYPAPPPLKGHTLAASEDEDEDAERPALR